MNSNHLLRYHVAICTTGVGDFCMSCVNGLCFYVESSGRSAHLGVETACVATCMHIKVCAKYIWKATLQR